MFKIGQYVYIRKAAVLHAVPADDNPLVGARILDKRYLAGPGQQPQLLIAPILTLAPVWVSANDIFGSMTNERV